jgi:NAD(P)-dependent dehydrogenase (short-subunit alcohol dehydrogenase family)/acyl dehydratase
MIVERLGTHLITDEEQAAFARLSGDFNPIHVNPLIARRSMFGRTITHGLHLVLRALEWNASQQPGFKSLSQLNARFFMATHPAESISVQSDTRSSGDNCYDVTLTIFNERARLAARCQARWTQQTIEPHPLPTTVASRDCHRLSDGEIAAAEGELPLFLDPGEAAALFPALTRLLRPNQFGDLLATTRIIGMSVPGRDSIFASANLTFSSSQASYDRLSYRTESFAPDRRYCTISAKSPGISGRLEAFVRPSQVDQPRYSDIRALIPTGVFNGHHALVIGGTRGLGEVCAKLLAAGGAQVTLTYHRGVEDADRVAQELSLEGAQVSVIQVDATDAGLPEIRQRLSEGIRFTGLYYFATPAIFTEAATFDYGSFVGFADVYVGGVARAFSLLAGLHNDAALRRVFIPSSIAVETRPPDMTGYAMAKAAMEYLVGDWASKHPTIRFLAPRLPRLATDQTATLAPVHADAPASLLARILVNFTSQVHDE